VSISQTERARTNTEPSCTRVELCYGNEIKDRCLNQGVEPTGRKIGTLSEHERERCLNQGVEPTGKKIGTLSEHEWERKLAHSHTEETQIRRIELTGADRSHLGLAARKSSGEHKNRLSELAAEKSGIEHKKQPNEGRSKLSRTGDSCCFCTGAERGINPNRDGRNTEAVPEED
jgi:hypothetical protein